jgi:putative ABC transport system permease protein
MLGRLKRALRALLRRTQVERELDEELRYHIEQQTEQNIRMGMNPEEARYAARKAFGGVEQAKERSRDAQGMRWLEELWQDLRYCARMLAKNPGFTLIVTLTLSLGIGANMAMFSIIHAVMLRPLPYKDAGRLVGIFASPAGQAQTTKVFASYQAFKEWRLHSRSFEQLEGCTWAAESRKILLGHGAAQHVFSIPVTSGYFSLLGVRAEHGRAFEPQDLKMECAVVLSHGFWKDRLGGSPDIVGSSLRLNDQSCAVIGVMPKEFEFYPRQAQLWTLITQDSAFEREPWRLSIGVFGRLKPDVSSAWAQAELALLHRQITSDAPQGFKSWSQYEPTVDELQSQFTWLAGRNLRTGLVVLFGAVVCVLLIACVNVAGLQLARASVRAREMAIRAALGSGRFRLIRQMMTETMTLALLGAVLGTALAFAGVSWFRSSSPVELPPGNPVTVNWQTLIFTAGMAILVGLLSGLTPALKASRIDLNGALKDATRGSSGRGTHRAARVFIIAEVALSLALLTGAGQLIQSIVRLSSVPLGFRIDHLFTAGLTLPASAYPESPQQAAFYNNLLSRLRARPGIEAAAVEASDAWNIQLTAAGKTPAQNEVGDVNRKLVSADYLATMGIPLLQGRPFKDSDHESSQPVAVINEALARKYFPNEDPVGRQIKLGTLNQSPWLTIVGVAGNIKEQTLFNEMALESFPTVYCPVSQSTVGSVRIMIRATGDVAGLGAILQREISAMDQGVPVPSPKPMAHQVSTELAHPRFRAILLSCFAGLALLLVAIGIYGTLSQTVSQRIREIGIRMALGAERRDVLLLFIRQGLILTLAGAAIGVAGALLVTRFLAGMLYGVKPADPATFGAVLLMLGGVAALASYFPARRATKVDPIAAIRNE